MNNMSSGTYMIDSEYNITYFNGVAGQLYPMLEIGKKCYKALMNREEPCEVCPVLNEVKGPRTYLDPIRHVYETVDAVDLPASDGTMGHALVFSIVGESGRLSDRLSTNDDGLRLLNLINTDNSVETMKMMESIRPGSMARHRTILIAEDNELNREILVELLKDDYDILEAVDGEEALALLKKHYSEISVILLDLIMPKLTGYEFMENVKTNIYFSAIPIIVMTGSVDKSEEEHCLELGAIDFIPKPYKPAIVKSRIHNIIRMRETAASLNAIEIDDLTGLYTRQAFLHHAQTLLDAHPEDSYDIVLLDIQSFKLLNSIYGLEKADGLLRSLAGYIKSHTENGICARYGSDQFISIFKSVDRDKEKWLTDKIREFETQAPIDNIVVKCGVYENVDRTLTVTHMCDRALLALKSIKHNNDRMYAFYDGPVSQRQLRAQQYELHFREAIEKKEFVVWYQPKYDPYTEKVVGAEALVRWKRKDGYINPPGDFLSVFEEDGLIGQLDEYVFRTVCEYQKKWMEIGKQLIPISINLSRNSMHQTDLVERYKKITEEYGISPSLVPIEITESAAVESLEIKPLADAFYEAGFSLHMDDFGSGRSSLNGLNLLHFDVVKLDKSLIDFIGEQRGDMILMYTMALSKELGLHLVAEGVEDEKQLIFLRENGCDTIQGYYYSKPLPPEEFEQKIRGNLELHTECQEQKKKYKLISIENAVKRAMVRMLHRMPGGFFTYEADGDERILSSNHYLWHLFGCDTEEEFMQHVGGSFRGIVCPDELERVEESIKHQIQGSANDMDYVEYHIMRKDGIRIPVVDYGHLDRLEDGDIFYVFISEVKK